MFLLWCHIFPSAHSLEITEEVYESWFIFYLVRPLYSSCLSYISTESAFVEVTKDFLIVKYKGRFSVLTM